MIIQLPIPDHCAMAAADILFDLDKAELWINSKNLPKSIMGKIGMTTLEFYRKKNQTYFPMKWCAYEWDGCFAVVDALRSRYEREMARLDKYREQYKPVEVVDVVDVEQRSDSEYEVSYKHPIMGEAFDICIS